MAFVNVSAMSRAGLLAVICAAGIMTVAAAESGFRREVIDLGPSSGYSADLVKISGPTRSVYVWGVGSEDETSTKPWDPPTRHMESFKAQCDYSLDKIQRILGQWDSTLADVTTLRVYLTDGRYAVDVPECLKVRFGTARPAVTIAKISALAHPGMLIEMEATTASPLAAGASAKFAMTRTDKTLGVWNKGATEVLSTSGTEKTVYLSALRPVQKEDDKVALFPMDGEKQCVFANGKLKKDIEAAGLDMDAAIRATLYITEDATLGDYINCRMSLDAKDVPKVADTLANTAQLPAYGEAFAYDVLAVGPTDTDAFSRVVKTSYDGQKVPDSVVIAGPRSTYYVGGVLDTDDAGKIVHKADFAAQCKAVVGKIDARLKKGGAALADSVKFLTYVTDVRDIDAYRACMDEAFGGKIQPAQTVINVGQLPASGALIEIDAIAATSVH